MVSVIYLNWNRKDDLLDSLSKIYPLVGLKTAEIVVIDQGSSDGSAGAIRYKFPLVKIVEVGRNIGIPAGRNLGAETSVGEILLFLDNDAYIDSHAIFLLEKKFAAEPSLGIIGFQIRNYYDKTICNWTYSQSMKRNSNRRFDAVNYVGCGHAIKRDLFRDAGGYDPELFFWGEELDLVYKTIALRRYRIVYDPDIVVYHKIAPKARYEWTDNRLYFKVRNRFYLILKHFSPGIERSILLFYFFAGYFFRALGYLSFGQFVRGLLHAIQRWKLADDIPTLNATISRQVFLVELFQRIPLKCGYEYRFDSFRVFERNRAQWVR